MRMIVVAVAVFALAVPAAGLVEPRAPVVSTGARFDLKKVQKEETTLVLLFTQSTSAMEQQFVTDLMGSFPKDAKLSLGLVNLKETAAPAAQQYSVAATPTAVVFDRFGREIGRSSEPEQIRAAVRKGQLMARIAWIDEDHPKAPETYGAPAAALKRGLPGIVKSMALRPEVFKMFNMMSEVHFTDGFLKRREHEMIAAYVSGLNKCKF